MTSIAEIEAFALRYPEPHDAGRGRCVTLVRITTGDGGVGWGEAISQLPESALATKVIIDRGLAPLLVDRDPTQVRRRWTEMREHSYWHGRGGIVSFAISAIDIALWDLAGKLAGMPVHRLLGGKLHDRVRACASVVWDPGDLDTTGVELAEYAGRGYTWVKAGWGRNPATAFGLQKRRDLAVVRVAREALGQEVELSCDVAAHARWTPSHAVEMARALSDFRLAWLEDALDHHDHDGWRRLQGVASMPLATGERCWTVEDYRRLVRSRGVDIVLVDPGRVEGITGMTTIVDDALAEGVRFVPHSWSSALNTAAALHVFATRPNGVVFELKPNRSPMQHELVAEPFEQVGGFITVPDTPGLGVDIVEETVRTYEFA